MTTYQTIRLETKGQEVFFQIEITCDTGTFNYAKWMTPAEAQEYIIDTTTFDSIITNNYLQKAVDEYNNTPPADLWHDNNCLIQITQSNDDCLQMLEEYPEIALYRKQEGIATFRQYNNIYNYVNYVLVVHYELLKSYNCEINAKIGYKLELDNDRYIAVIDN